MRKQAELTWIATALFFPALALANDPDPASELQGKEAAAILLETYSDVKVRKANELVWKHATKLMRLFDRDAVKTGEGSTAVIQFQDDTSLNVDQKSIVIIMDAPKRLDSRESVVAIPAGTVQGQVSANVDRPVQLTVRTRRGWIQANSAKGSSRFRTTVAPNADLKVAVQTGEVKVAAQGREKFLKEGQKLTIAAAAGDTQSAEGDLSEFEKLPVVDDPALPLPSKPKPPTRTFRMPPKKLRLPSPTPSPEPKPTARPVPSPTQADKPAGEPVPSPQASPTAQPTPQVTAQPRLPAPKFKVQPLGDSKQN